MLHRRDIEGLRAIAVVAVLLFHFGVPHTGGGYIGVDVFFVISGFLITSLLVAERDATGRISMASFYTRRIRRLLPISAVVLVATAISAAIWLNPTRLNQLAHDIFGAAGFFVNYVFAERGADYLGSQLDPSALQHYWSLAVEEQFYMVWPALVALVTWRAVNIRNRLLIALSVIFIGSLVLSIATTQSNPSWAYFGLHTRAWELALGAIIAVCWRDIERVPSFIRAIGGWVGIGLIVFAVVRYGSVYEFPGWVALVPVVGAGLALSAGNNTKGGPTSILGLAPLQWIGARSYSLYLWHWPALIIATSNKGAPLSASDRWKLLVLVVVVAEIGFRLVENPIRRSTKLQHERRLSFAMGGALVVSGVIASVALAAYNPSLTTGYTAERVDEITTTTAALTTTTAVPRMPDPLNNGFERAPQAVIDALTQEKLPDNLRPALNSALVDSPVLYDNNCHQYMATTVPEGCVFGRPNARTTVALFGDSHAAQWFTAIESIAKERKWRVLALTQGSCPIINVLTVNLTTNVVYRNCDEWREAVFQRMKAEKVDVVFLTQYTGFFDVRTRNRVSPSVWESGLDELFTRLQSDGVTPVFFADNSDPDGSPVDCLASNRNNIQRCTQDFADVVQPQIEAVMAAKTAQYKVSIVWPSRWTCHEGRCPMVTGDIMMYRDGNHLTDTFVRWLTPVVDANVGDFVDGVAAYNRFTSR